MNTDEMTMGESSARRERRVVEAEIRLPKLEELELPKIDLEPARAIAEQALLTGIGVGVLIGRGVVLAVKAAHRVGSEAAEHPGPITQALLSLVRGPAARPGVKGRQEIKVRVPILPIDNYDQLSAAELVERLASLSNDQLRVLYEYETTHQNRKEVLKAIDKYLTAD